MSIRGTGTHELYQPRYFRRDLSRCTSCCYYCDYIARGTADFYESAVDPRTFHRFLVRHETRLKQLFTEIVRLAQKMGLVKLGRVAIDGSKFKATTSKHKAMSYGRMVKAIEQLNKELSELKKSLSEANKKEATNLSETLPEEIRRREKRLQKIQKAKVALKREKGVALKEKDQKSFNDHDALPLGGK